MGARYAWDRQKIIVNNDTQTYSGIVALDGTFSGSYPNQPSVISIPSDIMYNSSEYVIIMGGSYTQYSDGTFGVSSGSYLNQYNASATKLNSFIYNGVNAHLLCNGYRTPEDKSRVDKVYILFAKSADIYPNISNARGTLLYEIGNINQLGYGGSVKLSGFFDSQNCINISMVSYGPGGNWGYEGIYADVKPCDMIIHKSTTSLGAASVITSNNKIYPDNGQSGTYWYTYKGSDNIDPTIIRYPSSIKGGQSINLTTSGGNNVYGGTITYMWEVSLSGGGWTSIGTSTTSTKSYVVPKGTTTFQARVKVKDNLGFTSTDYATGSKYSVINNTNPDISGEDANLGNFTYSNPPVIKFTITDAEQSAINYTVTLDGQSIMSGSATSGREYTVNLNNWSELEYTKHTIKITANDGQGGTDTRTYTFTKINTTPAISGEDEDLGIFRYEYPSIAYRITDNDNQTITRKIELDSKIVIENSEVVNNQEYTYTVSEEDMLSLEDGEHSIVITASDSEGATAKRTYQFTKFFGPDTLYQRLRRLNNLGLYDTIYFENMASNIIRPNGMSVQESIDKIEADLSELEK